jgi:FtsH-binding integral membrane protein
MVLRGPCKIDKNHYYYPYIIRKLSAFGTRSDKGDLSMSNRITQATATAGYGVSESASKVLRNTYMLLSMTLFFSAGMTALAVSLQAPPMHWLLSLGGMIGLLFALQAMRNSVWALPL